jgi:hypothetical protein
MGEVNADAIADAKSDAPRLGKKAARAVKIRRWISRALIVAPAVAILFADVGRRHERLSGFDRREIVFYALSVLLSIAFWGSISVVASTRKHPSRWLARVLLVLGAAFAVGAQLYTYGRYQAYLDHRAVLVGTQMMPSVGQQIWFDRFTVLRTLGPPIVFAIALPFTMTRLAPAKSLVAFAAWDTALTALLFALFLSPDRGAEQGTLPDVMYLSSMGQLARARWDHNETVERVHPGPRTPIPVPKMVAKPARPRNVIMIINESVRAQSVCVEYMENGCKYTPFSNAEMPNRIPLTQMRALDSTTAISLSIMWNGLPPIETREAMHSAPLLWEYANAADIDRGYWTSQNLLFGNSGTWLEGVPITRKVSATQLEKNPTYETGADDGTLVDYVIDDIGHLKEPFLAVVHLSNTHFPYKVDPNYSPFLPEEEATGPGYENEIWNRYQDSIYLQDVAVGRLLRALKKRPEASRNVIMYISDHGEQMREKGAVGHTGTLFEPEVRIPAWIDAPDGTLTNDERSHLVALERTPLLSLDVFPTVMDLLGLWDAPEMKPFRAKVPGESMLRGGSPTDRAVVMTNCSPLWACAFKNWGAIRGSKKLIAHQGDSDWNCYDVEKDPEEKTNLGKESCGDLLPLAEHTMGGRPFGGSP